MKRLKAAARSIWKALKWEGHAQENVLVNVDRAGASEFGAPVDYTISGEAGKHRASDLLAAATSDVLDAIQPGHVENAERVDQALTETREKVSGGT